METDQYKKDSVVYRVNVKPSGKFYLGSTCDIYRRLRDHFNGKQGSNVYLANAVARHGLDNIEIYILKDGLTREKAYIEEQQLLNKYFKDPLNMNFSNQAKGFNGESNYKVVTTGIEEEYLWKTIDLKTITCKELRQRYPILKDPSKMTTRELIEYKKDNRPFKYAIKEPSGEIIYIREWALSSYLKSKKLPPTHLYRKGYCNNYFMTQDLTKEGINKLKLAKYKISKGNSKKYKVYLDDKYINTIENLKQWCKEKDLNYNSCSSLARGITKKPYKGYTFLFD